MTTTSTDALQELMASRKAEINGQPAVPEPDYIPSTYQTGYIVSVAAADGSPTEQIPSALPAAAPAPDQMIPFPPIPPKVIGGLPYAPQYAKLARTICNTEMVPTAMRGRWDAVTAAFMRGYEMGLGPMQALDSFNVIEGKVGLTAEAMRALIIQSGHQILLEDVYTGDQLTAVSARCHRAEWPPDLWMEYRFSIDDARQAGLLRESRSGKPTSWQTYPRAMMDARATSGAGRRYFPDVLAGMSYTPEEIRDFDGPAEQEVLPSDPIQPPSTAPGPSASEETADAVGSVDSTPTDTPTPASPPPAKRGPGRPKKASAAPVPPAETSAESSEASPEPAVDLSTVVEHGDPGGQKVSAAMLTAYREIVAGLPQAQQAVCRAFIAQHFPGRTLDKLSEDEIQKACDIACGWPESAARFPIPENGQQELI